MESLVVNFGGISYLAAPYTHTDHLIRERRYELVTEAAAKLVALGHIVFSPLTMTHPIDKLLAAQHETLGSDYWVRFDEAFMKICSTIIVLKLAGWEMSRGVSREIAFFESAERPVQYLDPSQLALSPNL